MLELAFVSTYFLLKIYTKHRKKTHFDTKETIISKNPWVSSPFLLHLLICIGKKQTSKKILPVHLSRLKLVFVDNFRLNIHTKHIQKCNVAKKTFIKMVYNDLLGRLSTVQTVSFRFRNFFSDI